MDKNNVYDVVFVDDETTLFIEFIQDFLKERKLRPIQYSDVSEARENIDVLLNAKVIVLDLMMPETDIHRDIPADPCEVGFSLFEHVYDRNFKGAVMVLTNARPENHPTIFSRLKMYFDRVDGRGAIVFKFVRSPGEIANAICDLTVNV